MKVAEVMTTKVISLEPAMPYKDAVMRLVEARVSGAPVVDDSGQLVGVVTEADLASKQAFGRHSRALARLADVVSVRAHQWATKASGFTVAEVMTKDVITCSPEDSVRTVARRMLDHGVKRMPVVEAGRVAGIVSRRDLLEVLLRPDALIREDLEGRLRNDPNRPDDAHVHCNVVDGVATLSGDVRYPWDIQAVIELARDVEGVIDVVEHLHNREIGPRPSSESVVRPFHR